MINHINPLSQRLLRDKKRWPYILGAVLIVIVSFYLLGKVFGGSSSSRASSSQISIDSKAKKTLNKEFSFPIKDDKGKEITRIKYTLLDAQLQDQIIVKGQRTYAIDGKMFLVFTLKLQNDYSQGIRINTRDYIRLITNNNGKEERLAPEIHNDPVLVQAISTKYTRFGFAINSFDKDLTLAIGEINGPKETIKISF